jgi:hypothetical protein
VPDEQTISFTELALAKVDTYIAGHPGYSRQGVAQPGQGATNRVVFARRGEDRVVFKVFCERERKERECYALHHWRETGHVPELIADVDSTMIVMSHVPGVHLMRAREVDGDAAWRAACREAGRAIGTLTRVPWSAADRTAFEARFYDGLGTLDAYLGRVLELGWSIYARDPDYRDVFWGENLAFIERQREGILSQPRVLYHQDVSNLHVRQGRFMGFYDLEMCRAGCAVMQLASSLGMLEGEPAAWVPFREGWEAATHDPLGADERRAVAAANHLLRWREICRYMSYDGTPGSGYPWASPADPVQYRASMEATERLLEVK